MKGEDGLIYSDTEEVEKKEVVVEGAGEEKGAHKTE